MKTPDYEAQAAKVWPSWSDERRARWAAARAYADRCRPRYARLLPMYPDEPSNVYSLSVARTMREAGMR